MKKSAFIKDVTAEIVAKRASLFLGAGVSRGSGFSDWKTLMKDIAEELELDIEKESDLISIAQYYQNRTRSRNKLNQKIIEEFDRKAEKNELLSILCQLPISSLWTTNYDGLIENEYVNLNKILDVKRRQNDLAISKANREATLYKIHGDVTEPDKAVITRDDYERFDIDKGLFVKYLTSELISRCFIFIGYSFNDPNFNQILSKIRIELLANKRTHFYVAKRESNEYDRIRQKLKIEDLLEYGIQTIEIDDYHELVEIFSEIRHNVFCRNVFISGSAAEYQEFSSDNDSFSLIKGLSRQLILEDFTVVNGHGIGVGEHVIQGIVEGLANKSNIPENPFVIKVFPQQIDKNKTKFELWTSLRENMISQCRTAIFMFGNKCDKDKIVLADGMFQEYQIALKYKLNIILISSTGYQTKVIADQKRDESSSNVTVIDSKCSEEIIKKVLDILK